MAAYSDSVIDMLDGVRDITEVAAKGNPVLSPTNTTERLAAQMARSLGDTPGLKILVAESGIHTRADVERLTRSGARAILVGESLMRHGDIRDKVTELLTG